MTHFLTWDYDDEMVIEDTDDGVEEQEARYELEAVEDDPAFSPAGALWDHDTQC